MNIRKRSYNPINDHINALVVSIGLIDIYFSYDTIIAIDTPITGLVIRKNSWNNTTARHLNMIDRDKSKRIDSHEFNDILDQIWYHYFIRSIEEPIQTFEIKNHE